MIYIPQDRTKTKQYLTDLKMKVVTELEYHVLDFSHVRYENIEDKSCIPWHYNRSMNDETRSLSESIRRSNNDRKYVMFITIDFIPYEIRLSHDFIEIIEYINGYSPRYNKDWYQWIIDYITTKFKLPEREVWCLRPGQYYKTGITNKDGYICEYIGNNAGCNYGAGSHSYYIETSITKIHNLYRLIEYDAIPDVDYNIRHHLDEILKHLNQQGYKKFKLYELGNVNDFIDVLIKKIESK